MIYNEILTYKLINIFGNIVLEWGKNKIRNSLEEQVERIKSLILYGENKDIRDKARELFKQIKSVDDEFTELYINDIKENNLIEK